MQSISFRLKSINTSGKFYLMLQIKITEMGKFARKTSDNFKYLTTSCSMFHSLILDGEIHTNEIDESKTI